jgi:hypothetical protein
MSTIRYMEFCYHVLLFRPCKKIFTAILYRLSLKANGKRHLAVEAIFDSEIRFINLLQF